MPTLTASVVPTGGAIQLLMTTAVSGTISLSRAVSGSSGLVSFTTLYSGVPFATKLMPDGNEYQTPYIDVGDQLQTPLDQSTLYVYKLTDVNGSVETSPILPAVELNLQYEPLTQMLIRLLQGGINSLAPSAFNVSGGKVPQVIYDMPLAGFPPMPFVTVNLQLQQQEQIPIGQNVINPDVQNKWVLTGFARFVYLVSVLANSVQERDFYADAVIGIFNAILGSVLAPLGKNITHRYQKTTGQVVKDNQMQIPGFYYADIMLEFEGTWNLLISMSYGVISSITFTGTTKDGTEIQAEVKES